MASAPGRHVFRDRRAGADVGALADSHRRNQLRIAADERAVLDDRLVLVLAVVVADDRARPDVDVGADRGVAEIGQMVGLRARRRAIVFFNSTKLPTLAPSPTTVPAADGRRARSTAPSATRAPTIRQKLLIDDAVADRRVDDADVRLDFAGGADARVPSMTTPGWITVSGPISTSGSI